MHTFNEIKESIRAMDCKKEAFTREIWGVEVDEAFTREIWGVDVDIFGYWSEKNSIEINQHTIR